jgi:hypothetical protein
MTGDSSVLGGACSSGGFVRYCIDGVTVGYPIGVVGVGYSTIGAFVNSIAVGARYGAVLDCGA